MLIKFSSIYYLITGQSLPKFVAIFYLDFTCLKDKLCPNLTLQNILRWDNYLDWQALEMTMFLWLILSELTGLFYGANYNLQIDVSVCCRSRDFSGCVICTITVLGIFL